LTGFDAWQLVLEQRILTRGKGKVFPYKSASASAAFCRGCAALNIKNLRFHDLRREAASRLFEAGLPVEKVALVTGHKSWEALRSAQKIYPTETRRPREIIASHRGLGRRFHGWIARSMNTGRVER